MHSVVTSVRNHRHALIESPTGTGKSLALLCSSLAVQAALEREKTSSHPSVDPKPLSVPTAPLNTPNINQIARTPGQAEGGPPTSPSQPLHSIISYTNREDSDDSDFAPKKTFRDVSWQRPQSREKRKRPTQDDQPANAFMFERLLNFQQDNPLDHSDGEETQTQHDAEKRSKKVPRVFYATRTHNQVAQVVSELRKTVYRPPICILASRKEYCIHEQVRNASARDEMCKSLVKAGDCQYYFEAATLAGHEELKGEAWDIEELNELGKRHAGCPYFASHELYQNAQLILCPYSFLVDPIVRRARGINISGDIVILDEAHNIENYARESASFGADIADMRRAAEEVGTILLTSNVPAANDGLISAYRKVKTLLECFISLVDDVLVSDELRQQQDHENAIYERDRLLQKLSLGDVTSDEVKYWRAAHDFIINYGDGNEAKRLKKMGDDRTVIDASPLEQPQEQKADKSENNRNRDGDPPAEGKIAGNYGYGCNPNTNIGEGELHMPQIREPQRLPTDSRTPLARSMRKGRRKGRRRGAQLASEDQKPLIAKCMTICNALLTTLEYLFDSPDDFTLVVDRRMKNFVTTVKITIHCLNAAVCFRELSSKARSIIVTSGTLSPISSFVGELGTGFATTKSLPHVIDVKRQLYVAVVGEGPGKVQFDATFRGSFKFAFQDALGDALIDYCTIVPGGVLVFFPSYRMMDQLKARWTASGAWDRLQNTKGAVLVEPNQRGEDFDNVISEYQRASSTDDGAVLFGVCRGKLSEGVDFKDETSRAVVLVGIPFPHGGDVLVSRKKSWNDRCRTEKKRTELQTGAQWYETQAFRALNQALGRAVRHRYDYSAILLVDSRFRSRRVLDQLPRWTKEAIRRTDLNHGCLMQGLDAFYSTAQEKISAISNRDRQNERV